MKLIEVTELFKSLMSIKASNDISFGLTWLIDDIIKALEVHHERYSKEHNELLLKHGEENPKQKGSYMIHPDNIEAYKKELDILLNYNIDVDLKKIKTSDLEQIKIKAGTNSSILRLIIDDSIEQ